MVLTPPQFPPLSALRIVRLAIVAGLISGVLESALRALLTSDNPEGVKLGAYLAWMPAAANGSLFLILALGLVPLSRWRREAFTFPRLVGLFGALAAFNVLAVLSPRVAMVSVLALALGIGTTLARLAAARPTAVERAIRWSAAPLLLLLPVVAGGIEAARAGRERLVLVRSAPAAAPNVLILLLDTVRAMNLSAYGFFRPTSPALATVAAAGVRFEAAYATSPWSLPSHGSLFTGRWAHELGVDWEVPLDGRFPTLAEALTEFGYASGGFVANLSYAQRQSGIARGFAHYEDYRVTPRQVLLSSRIGQWVVNTWHARVRRLPGPVHPRYHRPSATQLNQRLLRWVDGLEGRPFFAFVNYFDAHTPYYAPATFPDPPKTPVPVQASVPSLWIPLTPAATSAKYDKAITYIDHAIGLLLAELERRGLLDNTIVVVTSDHGEEFREHGVFGHGVSLYAASLRIPLLIRYPPRVPAGRVVGSPVSLRDVAATIFDLAGVANRRGLPGQSLARYWGDAVPAPDTLYAEVRKGLRLRDHYPVSKGDMRSVLVGQRRLILAGDGTPELYDHAADPWEQHNLARLPGFAAEVAALGSVLGVTAPAEPPCPPIEGRPAPGRTEAESVAGGSSAGVRAADCAATRVATSARGARSGGRLTPVASPGGRSHAGMPR